MDFLCPKSSNQSLQCQSLKSMFALSGNIVTIVRNSNLIHKYENTWLLSIFFRNYWYQFSNIKKCLHWIRIRCIYNSILDRICFQTNRFSLQDSIEDGHVIPGLIHKCYLAKKNGSSESIFYQELNYKCIWFLSNGDIFLIFENWYQ